MPSKIHRAKTSDMYGKFNNVTYPRPANAGLRFDFLFTKKGEWFYASSSDDQQSFANCEKAVVESGERWRVVETLTAKITKESNRN